MKFSKEHRKKLALSKLGNKNPNYKGDKAKYKQKNYCLDCGKEIHIDSKRCPKCHNSGENARKYIDGRSLIDHFCIDCGKKLSNYRAKRCEKCFYKIKHTKSPELCKLISENAKKRLSIPENNPMFGRKGKKAGNYINGKGYEPYTPEFNNRLRESIRKRDNYTCQNCGMTQEEHLILLKTKLHIHHIDYNKQNCNINNLITLCIKCNIKANYNRDYWQKTFIKILQESGIIIREINPNLI